jgi:hypothetical protein
MSSTEQSLDRHLDCFGRADLDGIVADYSPAAVMFTPRGTAKGTGCHSLTLSGNLYGVCQTWNDVFP